MISHLINKIRIMNGKEKMNVNLKRIINKYKYQIFCFLLIYLPRQIIVLFTYPVRVIVDEVATISSAALLAGYDWSKVISKAGYYGFGYYSQFWWVFKLTDDPIIIYRTILSITAILQGFVSILIFKMLEKHLYINSNPIKILFSVISSYLVFTRVTIAFNEHPIVIICWILVFLLLELVDSVENNQDKKKNSVSIGIGLLLAYSLTVHARLLVLLFAFIFAVLFYRIIFKRWLVSAWILISGIFIIFVSKLLIPYIQEILWLSNNVKELNNATIPLSNNLNFLELETWLIILKIIFSQITTATLYSGGLFIFSLVILTYSLFTYKGSILNKKIFLVSCVFISSIAATILAQSISWSEGILRGIAENIDYSKIYSIKVFTYIRYFDPYIAPFVLMGLIVLYHDIKLITKNLKIIIIIIILLIGFYMIQIVPYICNNSNASEVFRALSFHKSGDSVNLITYYRGIKYAILIIAASIILTLHGKYKLSLSIICIFFIIQYFYHAFANDIYVQKCEYNDICDSYELVKLIENEEKEKMINNIHVYDKNEKMYPRLYCSYQFYLNRYTIIPEIPQEQEEKVIFITNKKMNDELIDLDYFYIELNKNIFVYIKGTEYYNILSNDNYNLEPVQ